MKDLFAFAPDFVPIETMTGNGIGIENGTENIIENVTRIRIVRGTGTEIENETVHKNGFGDEIMKEFTLSFMLGELETLTRWASQPYEKPAQCLPAQLVYNVSHYDRTATVMTRECGRRPLVMVDLITGNA
ncbi:hypothetical protein EVAR_66399_1 [Eumeta japonica]|uniref:Uncharacterized protein n=1 Tax=Eumeta variegata TaxID=151549 RepID=A0A4C2A727_EUMVA|nr:hypothetical protein EVAR_66399_1 [Eumeta japonica]